MESAIDTRITGKLPQPAVNNTIQLSFSSNRQAASFLLLSEILMISYFLLSILSIQVLPCFLSLGSNFRLCSLAARLRTPNLFAAWRLLSKTKATPLVDY